jgi:hypothetical protein
MLHVYNEGMAQTEETDQEIAIAMLIAAKFPEDQAREIISALPVEQLAETIANLREHSAERDAFRSRLMADVALRMAVAPHTSYKTAEARYQISLGAVRIVEGVAKANKVDVDDLIQALSDEGFSIRDSIERLDQDPRFDGYIGGSGFYEWKCRVNDAVKRCTASRERAKFDAWKMSVEAKGMQVCDRCGGAGGHDGWPGFTCYKCGGERAIEKEETEG